MNFFANFSKGCNSIQIVLYDIRRPNHSQAEGPPGYYQVRPWLRTSTWWFFGKFLVRDFQKIRKWAGSSSTAGRFKDQGVVKHMHTIILRILMQSKVPKCAPLMQKNMHSARCAEARKVHHMNRGTFANPLIFILL